MFDAFKTRKPWAAALIGFIFGPVVLMLYLGRGRAAVGYFLLIVILTIITMLIPAFRIMNYDPSSVALFIGLVWRLFGAALGWNNKQVFVAKWYARWPSLVGFILLPYVLILGALEFREFVMEPGHIMSQAMEPTLNQGDYLLFDKSVYDNHGPERGDIVLLNNPPEDADYIRRVIGLPGDVLQLKDGVLIINKKPLARKQIATGAGPDQTCTAYVETLPEGKEIQTLQCNAKPTDSPEYTVPAGQYFVLGDNRDHSEDSRDALSFVPVENIRGKASFIYWNEKTNKLSMKAVN